MSHPPTCHNIALSSGANVAYVSTGTPDLPTLVLLHGFPSSSNQYRNLIPLLSSKYYIIAPDLPGFGLTTVPSSYVFTFENFAKSIGEFLEELRITSYAVYIFDYGAPLALRMAIEQPQSVKAIISQNGNAYVEGLGMEFWRPIEALWASENAPENREIIRQNILTLETTKFQYTAGVPEKHLPLINPAAYTYDYLMNLQTRGKKDIQLDLLYDYRTNVGLYPEFQAYLRKSQVPLLAVWGKGDPAFVPAGAEAFERDLTHAIVKFVDAGHFALETKLEEIAAEVWKFLEEVEL